MSSKMNESVRESRPASLIVDPARRFGGNPEQFTSGPGPGMDGYVTGTYGRIGTKHGDPGPIDVHYTNANKPFA